MKHLLIRIGIYLTVFLNMLVYPGLAQGPVEIRYDSLNRQLFIEDPIRSHVIYMQNMDKIFWTSEHLSQTCGVVELRRSISPEVNLKIVKGGVDIRYRFVNSGEEPMPIGEFYLGKFNLDSTIFYRNPAYTFSEEPLRAIPNALCMSQAHVYPSTSAYAPVTVFRNSHYIVGISFIYPFLSYKHTINQLLVGTFYSGYPPGWEVIFQANMPCNGQNSFTTGDIQPGETREYVLALRVARLTNGNKDWKKVIEPYKTYFSQTYGKPKYQSDRRPVIGYHGVNNQLQGESNPYGYWNVNDEIGDQFHPLRIDRYGFSSTAEYLEKMLKENKCKRVMVWAPTGLYYEHPDRNYPFQFTSHWGDVSLSNDAGWENEEFSDAYVHLFQLQLKGYSLGLWWGHSVAVTRVWDSAEYEMFDISNIEHWDLSFRELDGGLIAGATMIGLDSYSDLNGWSQIEWLKGMRTRAGSSTKFIVEQYTFDVAHSLAAFFYAPWNVHGNHELADFLLPGNEKWILLIPDQIVDLETYARQTSKWGFTPCKMTYLGAPFHKLKRAKR